MNVVASTPNARTPQADCASRPGHPCDIENRGAFLDRSGIVGTVEVRQCRRCGHGVTHPPIPDVAFLYGERESQDYQPDAKGGLAHRIKDIAFRFQARKLLRNVGRLGDRALDFGCGSGQFTRVLGELSPGTDLVGSDFFDTPPDELAGRSYTHSQGLASQGASFDTVMAFHVLEHDDDAGALLDQIIAPVRPGGAVVIEVPNVECVWNRLFGRFWDAWYMPYHRHHFSRQSLVHFMERRGLKVKAVHPITSPTMGRTMANLAGGRNNLAWLLIGIVLHPLQWIGEAVTRQPTSLRVVATKP